MITAKNYAAQAERDLRFLATRLVDDETNLLQTADDIKNAIHFVLPDTGRILYDDYKGLEGNKLRLPYPTISIEFYVPQHNRKLIVVAKETDTQISFMCFCSDKFSGQFIPIMAHCGTFFSDDVFMGMDKDGNTPNYFIKIDPSLYCSTLKDSEYNFNFVAAAIRPILELLEALSCRNVSTTNHQEAFTGNAKRVKAGKLPFYETRMLVIDTQYNPSGKTGNGGGSHASPRQHLRRGHIRRHQTAGNIWIQSSVVGDPTKGSINKSYQVR